MPTFSELWKQHPNIAGDAPILDKTVYENQCAINLSAALMRCGVVWWGKVMGEGQAQISDPC